MAIEVYAFGGLSIPSLYSTFVHWLPGFTCTKQEALYKGKPSRSPGVSTPAPARPSNLKNNERGEAAPQQTDIQSRPVPSWRASSSHCLRSTPCRPTH